MLEFVQALSLENDPTLNRNYFYLENQVWLSKHSEYVARKSAYSCCLWPEVHGTELLSHSSYPSGNWSLVFTAEAAEIEGVVFLYSVFFFFTCAHQFFISSWILIALLTFYKFIQWKRHKFIQWKIFSEGISSAFLYWNLLFFTGFQVRGRGGCF